MPETVFANIRIILVEPAGPLNVGAIARVMKNMGLHQLVLVNPHCDPLGDEARQMAVHAGEVLEAAVVVATLPDALKGCQRALATTARTRDIGIALEPPRTTLPWLLEATPQETGALIFGPEDRGLSNEELSYAQRFVAIPSSPLYPSLNLAQAVAICCYELYQWERESRERQNSERQNSERQNSEQETGIPLPAAGAPLVSLDRLEAYYQHLEAVLLKIGYLYPHTAASRMQKFRLLLNRALPSNEEVAMLRGILSQLEWALHRNKDGTSDNGSSGDC